jgi:adenine deaminase
MSILRYLLVAVVALAACIGRATMSITPAGGRVTEYRGGHWFDGTRFVPRTMYVVGTVFQSRRPARTDTLIDLNGGFVVPPFADAHQHLAEPNLIRT